MGRGCRGSDIMGTKIHKRDRMDGQRSTKGFNPVTTKQTKSPKNDTTNTGDGESNNAPERRLFIKVATFDHSDIKVGTRIVDMYHFGTRNWLAGHNWWAMHNGHIVVTETATPEEVEAHVSAQRQALADKFNTERQHVAA